eukprot:CAMPEP_0198219852 /NCGR_PEP_ID=MMETSP1445-20131203/76500_1 /TAXON_ID=36898 /ORGANISM="Pyramimonas sp., Strain CCMP2087" /LENGTH=234 /DNA_ID=CAMNT_0043897417 /DNA_START=307 /DNA_END=1011 /DNA_ORIENTATION=-
MSSPSGGQWEELRKEARKSESEIDQKLAAFSKIGSGSASSSESANLLGESQRGDIINSKAMEIEGLLERLSDLNEAMGGLVNSGGAVARMHTLARHKDILMEFTQEFRRTRSTVTVDMRHHELLRGSTGITSSMDFLGGQGQPGNALRERNLIDNSSSAIDDVIEQAQASLSTLTGQREMFEGMGAKLNQLGNKYPAINSLMNAIRRKRSKDTIVLSAVIACCTLFLLIYWFSK